MEIDFIIVHIILSLILYFIINWIGSHSYSVGYANISVISHEGSKAIALNYLIRVLGPVVYIIIVSAIFYYFELDRYAKDIYLVNAYYIFLRLFYSLTENRFYLVNWTKQILYFISIFIFSKLIYDNFIILKKNILPDFNNISNELWIIIIIFIYQIFDKIELNDGKSGSRQKNYIKQRYIEFKTQYNEIVNELHKPKLETLAYAILIHEDFNRPKSIRFIERLDFLRTRKPHSLGVMQVKSSKLITDQESVRIGVAKLNSDYKAVLNKIVKEKKTDKRKSNSNYGYQYYEYQIESEIIQRYNGGHSYNGAVSEIASQIETLFYKGIKDKWMPSVLR